MVSHAPNWKEFLKKIKEGDPRNFRAYIIESLHPPIYAVEEMRKFKWGCDFCWGVRMDICCACEKSICEDHTAIIITGEKTGLEWYYCLECVKKHSILKLKEMARVEDERMYLEDQMPQEDKPLEATMEQ